MDEGILLGQLPVEVGVLVLVPPAVEPDGTDGAVLGEQLGQLVVHEAVVGGPVTLRVGATRTATGATPRSILALPVDVRVIEMNVYALFVTLVSLLLENCPSLLQNKWVKVSL